MTTENAALDWVPEACTLPTAQQPMRLAEFDTLFTMRDWFCWSRISSPCRCCCPRDLMTSPGVADAVGEGSPGLGPSMAWPRWPLSYQWFHRGFKAWIDDLKAARSNLRFQDRRVADLEAQIADPSTTVPAVTPPVPTEPI